MVKPYWGNTSLGAGFDIKDMLQLAVSASKVPIEDMSSQLPVLALCLQLAARLPHHDALRFLET